MEILWPYQDLSASWGLKARTDGVELYFNQSGIEREFHSLGMVEQWDTEEFAAFSQSQATVLLSPAGYIGQGGIGRGVVLLELEGNVRLSGRHSGCRTREFMSSINGFVAEILGIEPERVFVQVSETDPGALSRWHQRTGRYPCYGTGRVVGRRWL